ncbi:MAG: hypothetical protein K0S04_3215 [Herbinix sp.]|jgi:hypothetical protein|nr:hypothetical protein [Herbinix sp.]
MKKNEIILLSVCTFLGGLVLGFLIAPIKKGLEIGNNSGNTNNYNYGDNEPKDELSLSLRNTES